MNTTAEKKTRTKKTIKGLEPQRFELDDGSFLVYYLSTDESTIWITAAEGNGDLSFIKLWKKFEDKYPTQTVFIYADPTNEKQILFWNNMLERDKVDLDYICFKVRNK